MIEIRIHGRGGQGAVVASELLAEAAYKDGKYAQSSVSYSPERRGSPVEAFIRIDNEFITVRSKIYEPDCVIVLDKVLFQNVEMVTKGLKQGGWLIINTHDIEKELNLPKKFRIAIVDANRIASKYNLVTSAMPIVNTSVLGAFSRATQIVNIAPLVEAIRENVPGKQEENAGAAMEAYDQVKILGECI